MTQLAHRPNKIVYQKCSLPSFFRMWVEFLTPFHHLAMREKDVFAKILEQYFKIREQCDDPVLCREILWSAPSKTDMRNALGMSQPHFQMVLGKLRENGVLKDNIINPRYVPHIKQDSNTFELRVVFDYSTTDMPEIPANETITA